MAERTKFNKGVVIPPGVNTVDMNERGERSGPLTIYGTYWDRPQAAACVEAALRAWGVKDRYLINGVGDDKRMPVPSNEGGPEFMLLFADGKWRHASFRGINGPPWFRCEFEGFDGPTGRAAHMRRSLMYKAHHLDDKRREVERLNAEVGQLQKDLDDEVNKHRKPK